MQNRQDVIDRLQILKTEYGQTEKEFRKILAKITGKTSRTIRRWYALETSIQEDDIKVIAEYFGQHVHWLKYGHMKERRPMVDQIMSSNHYGAVIMKNGKAEEMNYKFIEMMKLTPEKLSEAEACEFVLSRQSSEVVDLCQISDSHAKEHGAYHHHMVMKLGDEKFHSIEITTLNINNDRVLRILVDKGIVKRT